MKPEEKLDSLPSRILEAAKRAAEARRLEARTLEREITRNGPLCPRPRREAGEISPQAERRFAGGSSTGLRQNPP